ncbi:hypothetical protein [Pseudactinotalea sp. Z1748]|uniref:hypothetical protein n=1 Tax=Pseudactinotalea sp. Z1748 TaxID=3413027 RepID=UPI003C7E168C
MNPTRTRRTGLRTGPVALVALAVCPALVGCSDAEPHEEPRMPEESVAGTRNSRTELTLTGPDGQVHADKVGSRDPGEARFSDASQIDPLVIRTPDAGEYRVRVRGFDERASTDFEDGAQLRSWVPDRVEIGHPR